MIPALIAPVLNRYDLLDRMLDSVDVHVSRALVIDNGREGFARKGWTVATPPFGSLGFPGSLNFGIMQTADAPWWVWAGNDVVFGPGDLAEWTRLMEAAGDTPCIVSFHFAAGAMNRALVEAVGLFDEWSFWPLYFDDTDFAWRCHLSGTDVTWYTGGMSEGADGFDTSLTIKSDPQLAAANARTWEVNRAAYIAKWGGPPGEQTFQTPWDSGLPLWATRPSMAERVKRMW